jgi:hypothetical protein
VLCLGEKTFRVGHFKLLHVDNPGEAFGAFGVMALDAPDWLEKGVEVQVIDSGTATS